MKQTKREFLFLYAYYDHVGIAEHLEQMAAKGWLLESIGSGGWKYRRIEPKPLRFSVVYFPKATQYDPAPSAELELFRELCAEAGWMLAADSAQIQAFYNEDPSAVPIETDAEVQLKNLHAAMKRSFLGNYAVLLLLALSQVILSVWRIWEDPIRQFSNPTSLISNISWLPLLLLTAVALIRYFRWYRRAKVDVSMGNPLPELRSSKGSALLLLSLAIVELLILLGAAAFTSRGMLLTLVFMLLYMGLMILISLSIQKKLKKMQVKARINRLVTFGVIAVLTVGMLSGMMIMIIKTSGTGLVDTNPAAETYEYKGITWKVYHNELPLTIQDLIETDYDQWSTKLTKESSPLLTYLEAAQDPRMDALGEPDLNYEIVIVKAGFLYHLCKQDYIRWLERDNDKLPQEYWDEYRPADPAPWGASEVYQRYSAGDPVNQFLICWPDRIAEIHFDWNWTITEEMMSITADKLLSA